MFKYFKLDDFNFNEKVVGIRVDLNSPIIDGKVVLNERIVAHAKTIKELCEKGAKVVILAHQGRKGKDDCISLKSHADLLSKQLGIKVDFINKTYSQDVEKKIQTLKAGNVLVLENLRFLDDETNLEKKDNLILKLEKLFNFYVIDAFSVAHRKQTSMIGFSKVPLVAGRVMQKEISGLNNISEVKTPSIYVLGGAKPDDLIEILEKNINRNKIDFVILGGVIGEIALMTKGYDIGKKKDFLKEKGFLESYDRIKNIIEKHKEKFILPKDVALFDGKKRVEISVDNFENKTDLLNKYMIQDVGTKSITYFNHFLRDAGSIYFKGPPGNFEDKNFTYGTSELIKAITKSKAYTYMGGGHSVTAIDKFANLSDFSYISLAGGALVKFLSGESLPGVEVLEKSFAKFEGDYEDFLVLGSNTIDTGISAPCQLSDFHLGDKIKIEEDFKTTVGGGGINVSICLKRLGSKVAYLGKLSFENIDKVKEVLQRDRVDLVESKLSKRPSAKSILIETKDNDRVILTYRGQNAYLEEKDFDLDKIKAKNYYFSSLSGESFRTLCSIAKKIKSKHKDSLICFNLSSHLIQNEKSLKNLVKYCDILVLNLEEAEMFTKKEKITDCFKEIKTLVSKVVVITDGSNGAYAYDGKNEYHVNANTPKRIVDTTGAGDCFAGTFFYFYSKSFGIQKSLQCAAKNSSNVVSYKGAQDGLLYYDDLI
ncbi:MAG: phosphoglycerate kinase [Candidatus Woesearchaeota archaeon]|jgi:phosphoglycerate kinase|nr:phosphoglycerate kinase [Candidatus Woesearchaeota archaeon]